MPEPHVVVAGGGASGVLLGYALIAAGASVTLLEPRATLGNGVAYSTTCPLHLLNVPAGRMSAFADRPNHFVEWLAANGHPSVPTAFLPRPTYGAYLQSIAADARERGGSRWRHLRTRAIDAAVEGDSVDVTCDDGTSLTASAFVVAVGNANPSPWPNVSDDVRRSPHFFDSAWHDGATHGADLDATVVLLGTGLTAVDAVLGLRYHGHRGPILMVSRRGLVPHEHRLFDAPPAGSPDATTIGEVIASARRAHGRTDADWRLTIDALRDETNARWEALSLAEQRRFVRHVMPYWNVHRHRMAPEAAKSIAKLLASGAVEMIAGRTGTLEATTAGIRVPVTLRGGNDVRIIEAGRVINCSGPQHDIEKRHNPLLRRLCERGSLTPHPLHIGSRIAADGALLDAGGRPSPRLFAIGPVRYGTLIETTAIPEIRKQVRELVGRLIGVSSGAASQATAASG
jgi:uncharacterized NAD(P)/FAD-binding protein YdhS